jgi:hypothetical protein
MQSKPKSTTASRLVSARTVGVRTTAPEWEMDSYGHFFANKFGLDSKIGKKIGVLMRECEEKCALAKLDMYAKIQETIKEAHKKPQ